MSQLNSVTVTSPSSAWAVGSLSTTYAWAVGYRGNKTLIERWNGTTWIVQPSPN